ncbi:hypothetical protein [Gynuella sunshinyii]|uniref:Uncharacterized protein n=1 Tax=Gynuella sunshinyii YC6258 TaxID=1445510 RepID=A0A0C5VFC8_9GAMM|nr:hypothetical protein [Gynuella sunshinyii]AJQ92871.1 hypothetical Protein YC6258_00821 [Gynuella sunshinyii YC6258]
MQQLVIRYRTQLIAFMFSLFSADCFSVELQKGQVPMTDLAETKEGYAFYFLSTGFPDDGIAFIEYDHANGLYYSLSRKLNILSNKVTRESLDNFKYSYDVLNNWPLTRWPYIYYPEVLKTLQLSLGESPENIDGPFYSAHIPGLGCMNETPLRYGQLFPKDEHVLMLVLLDQMIIFSPAYGRTLFAEYSGVSDWLHAQSTQDWLTEHHQTSDYQYISEYMTGIGPGPGLVYPGIRNYSKLYFGDFDQDGHNDILVWRKSYESNRVNESTGFTLQKNTWQHYEKDLVAQAASESGITGEYLPQDTSEAMIQGWLSANELTWQKGYPSTSECQDHEGELIPEMHDPLLNDPDVLK